MRKKGLLKRLTALAVGCLTMLAAVPAQAAATTEGAITWEEADEAYFKTTLGVTDDPSLGILKYQDNDETKPIAGVEFIATKVGALYSIEDKRGSATSGKHIMSYGLEKDFAAAIGLDNPTYSLSNGNILCFDEGVINANAQKKRDAIDTYIKNSVAANDKQTLTTDAYGKVSYEGAGYGLYLIMESDVSGAMVNNAPVAITLQQNPYVIAVPYYENGWITQVEVKTKNSVDTAELTKKIVENYNVEKGLITDNTATLVDTDTTSIDDTVEFKLHSTLPRIPKKNAADKPDGGAGDYPQNISNYVITDVLSKGMTVDESKLNTDFVLKTSATENNELAYNTDYTITVAETTSEDGTEYAGGSEITIAFTTAGLKKLTELATKDSQPENREYVDVYYKAKVNANAVIGPNDGTGNPNKAYLTYKLGTNSVDLTTVEDKVTVFTFEIDGKKLVGDKAPSDAEKGQIKFVLYKLNGEKKEYCTFTKGTDGIYNMKAAVATDKDAEDAVIQPLGTDGTFKLRGLELGTYYLEETATAAGYNLLKEPIQIEVVAEKNQENVYVGGKQEYNGKLDVKKSSEGKISVEIVNTKGFTLPATGGKGIWLFVLVGIAVVAAGMVYFVATGKKEKKNN